MTAEPPFRTIPAGAIRVAAFAGCVTAIAGMIVSSIDDADGRAVGFGLLGAASALTLVVVAAVGGFAGRRTTRASSVASAGVAQIGAGHDRPGGDIDDVASGIEDAIRAMVASGAEESTVRELVRRSVELGQRLGGDPDS